MLSECSSGRPQSLSEDNQVILLQSLLDNPGIYIQEVQEMYQEINRDTFASNVDYPLCKLLRFNASENAANINFAIRYG